MKLSLNGPSHLISYNGPNFDKALGVLPEVGGGGDFLDTQVLWPHAYWKKNDPLQGVVETLHPLYAWRKYQIPPTEGHQKFYPPNTLYDQAQVNL